MHISRSTRNKQAQFRNREYEVPLAQSPFKSLMHLDGPSERTTYTPAVPSRPSKLVTAMAVLLFAGFIGGTLIWVGTLIKGAKPESVAKVQQP
jgi:hypothetical protein